MVCTLLSQTNPRLSADEQVARMQQLVHFVDWFCIPLYSVRTPKTRAKDVYQTNRTQAHERPEKCRFVPGDLDI